MEFLKKNYEKVLLAVVPAGFDHGGLRPAFYHLRQAGGSGGVYRRKQVQGQADCRRSILRLWTRRFSARRLPFSLITKQSTIFSIRWFGKSFQTAGY